MIAREKSSQSSWINSSALRDDNRANSEIICRAGAFVRVKQYKNREVCLITRREEK